MIRSSDGTIRPLIVIRDRRILKTGCSGTFDDGGLLEWASRAWLI
jgi:hypothetical protein